MKNETFCSLKCRNAFFGFDEELALERLRPAPAIVRNSRPLRPNPVELPAAGPERVAVAEVSALAQEAGHTAFMSTASAREVAPPPVAGFLYELTARAAPVPHAFSEGALGEVPPSPEPVRVPRGGFEALLRAGGAVPPEEGFLPCQDWEILEGPLANMLQVAPHPLSTLGDPRYPICGLGVAEFDWAAVEEELSAPPEARWVDWTWAARDWAAPLASGEMSTHDGSVEMQLPVWLRIKRESTPGSCEYIPLAKQAKPAAPAGGIWPAEEDEVLTWRRSEPVVKAVSEARPAPQDVDRGAEVKPVRLAQAGWVGVPAGPRDDRRTANHREGETVEYSLETHAPGLPPVALDGELPGRPRVLPDEPAEVLFPFVIVDNTHTQSLRSWEQNSAVEPPAVAGAGIRLGQPGRWNRHLSLAPAGVVAAAAPANLEIDFCWPEARALAAPLVCAFESRETWDLI
jgi:hypothetical protein